MEYDILAKWISNIEFQENTKKFYQNYSSLFLILLKSTLVIDVSRILGSKSYMTSIFKNFEKFSSIRKDEIINVLYKVVKHSSSSLKLEFLKDYIVKYLMLIYKVEKNSKIKRLFSKIFAPEPLGCVCVSLSLPFNKNFSNKSVVDVLNFMILKNVDDFDFMECLLDKSIIFFEMFSDLIARPPKKQCYDDHIKILDYLCSRIPSVEFFRPFIPRLNLQHLENFMKNYMPAIMAINQKSSQTFESLFYYLKLQEIYFKIMLYICNFLNKNKPNILSAFIGSFSSNFFTVSDNFGCILDERYEIQAAYSKVLKLVVNILEMDHYIGMRFINNFQPKQVFQCIISGPPISSGVTPNFIGFLNMFVIHVNISTLYALDYDHFRRLLEYIIAGYVKTVDLNISAKYHDVLFSFLSRFYVIESDFHIWSLATKYFVSDSIFVIFRCLLLCFVSKSVKKSTLSHLINPEAYQINSLLMIRTIFETFESLTHSEESEIDFETLLKYFTFSMALFVIFKFTHPDSMLELMYKLLKLLDQKIKSKIKKATLFECKFYISKIYEHLCTNRKSMDIYDGSLVASIQEKWQKYIYAHQASHISVFSFKVVDLNLSPDSLIFTAFKRIFDRFFKLDTLEVNCEISHTDNEFKNLSEEIKLPISFLLLDLCVLHHEWCKDLISNHNLFHLFSFGQKLIDKSHVKKAHVRFTMEILRFEQKSLLTKLYFKSFDFLFPENDPGKYIQELTEPHQKNENNLNKYNVHYLIYHFKFHIKNRFNLNEIDLMFKNIENIDEKYLVRSKIWYFITKFQVAFISDFTLKNISEITELLEHHLHEQSYSKSVRKTLVNLYITYRTTFKLFDPLFKSLRARAIDYFINLQNNHLSLFLEFIYFYLAFGIEENNILLNLTYKNSNHKKIAKILLKYSYFIPNAFTNLQKLSDGKFIKTIIKLVLKSPGNTDLYNGIKTIIDHGHTCTLKSIYSKLRASHFVSKLEMLFDLSIKAAETDISICFSVLDIFFVENFENLDQKIFEKLWSLSNLLCNKSNSYWIKSKNFIKLYDYAINHSHSSKLIFRILLNFTKLTKKSSIHKLCSKLCGNRTYADLTKLNTNRDSINEWVALIHKFIIHSHPVENSSNTYILLVSFLLSFYKGTLGQTDVKILRIYYYYSRCIHGNRINRPLLFKYDFNMPKDPERLNIYTFILKPYEVLKKIDCEIFYQSINDFPIHRRLDSLDHCENDVNIYDPAFLMPLLAYMFEYQSKYTDFVQDMVKKEVLAYIIVSLTSYDDSMRKLGYFLLLKFEQALNNSRFHHKYQISLMLQFIRNSTVVENQRLLKSNALLLSKISTVLIQPTHVLYTFCSHLMCYFSLFDNSKIILLDRFIYGINKTEDSFFQNHSAVALLIDCLSYSMESAEDVEELIKADGFTIILEFAITGTPNDQLNHSLHTFIVKSLLNPECAQILFERRNINTYVQHLLQVCKSTESNQASANNATGHESKRKRGNNAKFVKNTHMLDIYKSMINLLNSGNTKFKLNIFINFILDYLGNEMYYTDKYLCKQTKNAIIWILKNMDVDLDVGKAIRITRHILTLGVDNTTICISAMLYIYFSIISNDIRPFLDFWPKFGHLYESIEPNLCKSVRFLMEKILCLVNEQLKCSQIIIDYPMRFDLFKIIISIHYISLKENHEQLEAFSYNSVIHKSCNTLLRTLLLQDFEESEISLSYHGGRFLDLQNDDYLNKRTIKDLLNLQNVDQMIDDNPYYLQELFVACVKFKNM
ncbi:Nucleolar pre-ribosomal-associated protein 1 [Thelohanellus kitauei]|uniref:Nucleolar pre-ribosomal-associated protein 1 n=1 Tax=Thelohanellus kitauei TaxID=669202 RepID=A0A0C2NEB3_THEKT|nr:Nucleolar pre-ribosomal-associated protein 1 [Thelohanellus kitauei]